MPKIAFDRLPPVAKYFIFYGAFAALFILYAIIVGGIALGGLFNADQVSESTMESIASFAPLVLKELSVPGELIPAILGGLMAWTAPSRAANVQIVLLLMLSAIAWLMYLHMQVFFGSDTVRTYLLSGGFTPQNVDGAVATLSSFADNVRSFAAVVFAAILGLRFNDDHGVLNPPVVSPVRGPAPPSPQQLVSVTEGPANGVPS